MKRLACLLFFLCAALSLLCACGRDDGPAAGKNEVYGVTFEDVTTVYDGTMHEVLISGTLPEGVSVTYENNCGTDAGTYLATATFTGEGYAQKVLTATLVIERAALSGVTFSDAVVAYDGKPHLPPLQGLPADAQISYTADGAPTEGLADPGHYTVTVQISHRNYLPLTLTATLTVQDERHTVSAVLGGRLYYAEGGLFRFNGTTFEQLSPLIPNAFAVAGETLYFVTDTALYATAGEEITKIAARGGDALATDGVDLYLAGGASDGIFRIKPGAAAAPKLLSAGEARGMVFAGGYLWFSQEGVLTRVSAEGGTRMPVTREGRSVPAEHLFAATFDGEVYLYFSSNEGIVRYSPLTRDFCTLTSDMGASFTVIGTELYYLPTDSGHPFSAKEVRRVEAFSRPSTPETVFRGDIYFAAIAAWDGQLVLLGGEPQVIPAAQTPLALGVRSAHLQGNFLKKRLV